MSESLELMLWKRKERIRKNSSHYLFIVLVLLFLCIQTDLKGRQNWIEKSIIKIVANSSFVRRRIFYKILNSPTLKEEEETIDNSYSDRLKKGRKPISFFCTAVFSRVSYVCLLSRRAPFFGFHSACQSCILLNSGKVLLVFQAVFQ